VGLDELIGAVLAGPDHEARPHQEALGALGAAAVGPVVAAIRTSKGPPRRRLAEAVGFVRDRAAVPALIELIDDDCSPLAIAVLRALEHLPDPAALPPLLDLWLWDDNSQMAATISAIGGPSIVEPYHATLGRWLGGAALDSTPEALADAVASFDRARVASLEGVCRGLQAGGDAAGANALYAALRFASSAETRERAAQATQHVVAPGIVAALRAGMQDAAADVRRESVFSAYYLGLGTLIPDLLLVGSSDADPTVAATAREAVARIAGFPPFRQAPEAEELTAWFEQHGKALDPALAHRGGEPLHPSTIAARIAQEPRGPWDRALEFQVITGAKLPPGGDDAGAEIGAAAVAWAAEHAAEFEPGGVYRAGRRIEVPLPL